MRIWRALKSLGCASLRDGVFLLPENPDNRKSFQELADETARQGGESWLLTVQPGCESEHREYCSLFDRTNDYAAFLNQLSAARPTLPQLGLQEVNRLLRKLRRDYESIHHTDYFPNDATVQAEAVWMDFVSLAQAALTPEEPHSTDHRIIQLDRHVHQGRTWATRANLWVDRVASAWLIRRFIDADATFLWLPSPADCPAGALGFDFDGATFTHVGERVTFEVLLASFGLEKDPALMRLGAMVRALDVGTVSVPEAAGFEAMLAGTRQRVDNDDQLLSEVTPVLNSLYAHFSSISSVRQKT